MSKATNKPSELGTLIVVLLKARNLNDKHSFWKQDVFAQATLNDVQKRSHVDIKGGQHPEWDSEVRFTVLKGDGLEGRNRKLEVACYAQEPKREDLLGKATVDISDTLRTGEFDDWVSLNVDGVMRGDIYLEMTYYANAPAPAAVLSNNKLLEPVQGSALGRRPSKLSPSDRLSRPIQQNAAGPSKSSPMQLSRLRDQSNNSLPPTKNGSLSALLSDEPVHSSAAIPNIRSPPLFIPSQVSVLPSILRPGSGGRLSSIPVSDPRQQGNFGHNRTPSDPSISPSNRLQSITLDVSLSPPNPYIAGSSAYTPVHSGLSNIDRPLSSNPYTGSNSAYISGQQHQQVSGGRTYSSAPPGAFIPENQSGPDGRSYSVVSHVQTSKPSNLDSDVSSNPYTGFFIPMGQHLQASSGRTYSPVPPTVSGQASGSSDPSVSPSNPYTRDGGVFSPENQLGPNVPSPAPPPVFVQTSRLSNISRSAPADPYTGGSGVFIAGQSVPSVKTAKISGYPNYVTSLQPSSSLSLPYNTVGVSPGPLAFPMPVIPVVMEPYGSSSYMRPGIGGRSESPRTTPVGNIRSEKEELDPYHLARYQTPLPLPSGSIKDPPPPPAPTIASLPQVSLFPPPVLPAPALDTTRIEALRKVEQDTAWKEQELRDLELAMQLDRELNP